MLDYEVARLTQFGIPLVLTSAVWLINEDLILLLFWARAHPGSLYAQNVRGGK